MIPPCQQKFIITSLGEDRSEQLAFTEGPGMVTQGCRLPFMGVISLSSSVACAVGVMRRHSVVSTSLWPRGLQPARLLCLWGFSRQECWSGLPCPPPGPPPNPGIKPRPPALLKDSSPSELPGKPMNTGVGNLSLPQGSSQPRNETGVSCIAGGFNCQLYIDHLLCTKRCSFSGKPKTMKLCVPFKHLQAGQETDT